MKSSPELPLVLVHILARNAEGTLDFYLKCLENQDYPKDRMIVFIRTNGNSDNTTKILSDWHGRNWDYRKLFFNSSNTDYGSANVKNHVWDAGRLDLIRHLRDEGFAMARHHNADFYFVADTDNFISPTTISDLVALNLPVVAPLLRYAVEPVGSVEDIPEAMRGTAEWTSSNFTNVVENTGDTQNNLPGGPERFPEGYLDILTRLDQGVHPVDLVHCTYLVRKDVFSRISYQNGVAGGYDYIIFGYNLRVAGIQQFLDNRKVYGYFTLAGNSAMAEWYMGFEPNFGGPLCGPEELEEILGLTPNLEEC